MTLEVQRSNTAAIALYRAAGFTEIGVRRNYYGSGEDALLMGHIPELASVRASAVP